MKKINWYQFLIHIILICFTTQTAQSQCDWIYADVNTDGYSIDNNGQITLFYCENIVDTIWAPNGYIDAVWEYETNTGEECQDWDWIGNNFFLSIDSNDPCLEGLNEVSVTFTGYTSDNENTSPDICVFNIEFYNTPNPNINLEGYNTDEQIIICEQNLVTLTANGLGAAFGQNTIIQWYLNGDTITGQNDISLDISSTNYDINSANVFYFTVSNYCTTLNNLEEESDWLTITIYEGYDECEPCRWEPFTQSEWIENDGIGTTSDQQFPSFTPNDDGQNDYFPENPFNEENRSFEGVENHPTCKATIYQLTIYNRIGREIWKSKKDNDPWDGKNENGKECKEGTYYYKMEYVLHPILEGTNTTTNLPHSATIISTGSLYLGR